MKPSKNKHIPKNHHGYRWRGWKTPHPLHPTTKITITATIPTPHINTPSVQRKTFSTALSTKVHPKPVTGTKHFSTASSIVVPQTTPPNTIPSTPLVTPSIVTSHPYPPDIISPRTVAMTIKATSRRQKASTMMASTKVPPKSSHVSTTSSRILPQTKSPGALRSSMKNVIISPTTGKANLSRNSYNSQKRKQKYHNINQK